MLNDILILDQQWLQNKSDFPPIAWPWYRLWPSPNYEWFPWSICNGCGMPAGNAYPFGHLVPSPVPFWDLIVLQLLRPDSSNLPCLYSTFNLEYPLVLSRFCSLSRERESDGQLRTSLYDKRDDCNFHITNFPFLSSNIPSSPAYGVFIQQLIRYARACSSYESFILKAARLSSKLLGQGYVLERLKSSLRKFYGDLIKHYEVSLSQMLYDILGHDHVQWHPQLISHYTNLRTYYRTGLYNRLWPYYQILEVSIEHCNVCG